MILHEQRKVSMHGKKVPAAHKLLRTLSKQATFLKHETRIFCSMLGHCSACFFHVQHRLLMTGTQTEGSNPKEEDEKKRNRDVNRKDH